MSDIASFNIDKTSPDNSPSSATTEISIDTYVFGNKLLLKLEDNGFITPDEKVKELIKELTESKCLYALKLLFENLQNKFSSQTLINSLKALANPTLFDYYSKENMARLELHLRTWVAVLEQIHFSLSPIILSKDLQDKIYDSLARFAEIHHKAIRALQKDDKNINFNYNIDFLLIHLRDTLHSLRNDEAVFQEMIRRIKDFLNAVINIAS